MRRPAAIVTLALAASSCAGAAPPARSTEPVGVAPVPSSPPGNPPDPAERSFRENLARANEEAEQNGWLPKQTTLVPGHRVAIVVYAPKPERAPAYKVARVQAVGSGAYQVVSAESGMIDLMKTKQGSLLWDLRGDHSASVVLHLTPCGAHCGIAKPLVLELQDDHVRVQPVAPACPTCIHDRNRDGIPEFDVRLAALAVAPCSRVSCGPSGALLVDVRGFEVWDGKQFDRDLAELAPAYQALLEEARRAARRAERHGAKRKMCPLNPLQVAARLYVYSRLAGESRDDALKRADRVMKGYDFAACKTEYDLLAEPKPWSELREEMAGWELPRLQRQREPR